MLTVSDGAGMISMTHWADGEILSLSHQTEDCTKRMNCDTRPVLETQFNDTCRLLMRLTRLISQHLAKTLAIVDSEECGKAATRRNTAVD
ncbi:Hypotetical protein [Gulosibacter molinativorax]|nr:Hypotetical protein [Gulosibacter molinativorax]